MNLFIVTFTDRTLAWVYASTLEEAVLLAHEQSGKVVASATEAIYF